MGGNIIVFVLGNLDLENTEEGKALPAEQACRHYKNGGRYPAIQVNEAPIKYLIQTAMSVGNPVTGLVYLCANSCLSPDIPAAQAMAAIPGYVTSEDAISTEEFFLARIRSYCEDNDYPVPTSHSIPFNPLRPADSLSGLMDALGADTRISIDITGGPRDAAILLTLAAQIIKMAATGTSIGEILYTHYSVKTIYRQNNTFDLIDLVNAIDAFTEYGRADQLKEFFGRSPYIWESTRRLCDAMEAFSNALTLCQPKGIERKVIEVQRCLDEAAEELGRLKRVYMLCTEALEDIESGSLDQTLSDTLKEIEALSPTAQLTGIKPQRLGEKLEQVRKASMMNRSELLFLSLFPAIREKFVPATDDQTSLTLELIKWCASHQMVVQALCIYRECIGQCLLDKGYFIELEEASELSERQRSQEIADLPKNCAFKSGGLYLSKFTSDERRPHPYYAIDLTTEPKLRSSIIWFSYLHATRNTIVHVDGNRGSFSYFFALEFLGKRRDEALDVPTLSQDILKAIDAIEHPNAASDSQWRRARSAAYDDMERYKQQNATS